MKTSGIVFLILSIIMTTVSCKKDNQDPENYFSYSGKTYNLDKAYLDSWGENENGSYDFDIYIVSSAIQYSSANDKFLGVGDVLYLDLNTSSANGLISGTYNYSDEREAFSFVDGTLALKIDMGNESGGSSFDIIGGKAQITVNGNEMTIVFDLTTHANTKVSGKFKGNLILM